MFEALGVERRSKQAAEMIVTWPLLGWNEVDGWIYISSGDVFSDQAARFNMDNSVDYNFATHAK
jgi:hypothetical protein